MWLDYAEEVVRYYDSRGMTSNFEELLDTVDKNVEDPMVKAFVKMELKSKYLFNKKKWHHQMIIVVEIDCQIGSMK